MICPMRERCTYVQQEGYCPGDEDGKLWELRDGFLGLGEILICDDWDVEIVELEEK